MGLTCASAHARAARAARSAEYEPGVSVAGPRLMLAAGVPAHLFNLRGI